MGLPGPCQNRPPFLRHLPGAHQPVSGPRQVQVEPQRRVRIVFISYIRVIRPAQQLRSLLINKPYGHGAKSLILLNRHGDIHEVND